MQQPPPPQLPLPEWPPPDRRRRRKAGRAASTSASASGASGASSVAAFVGAPAPASEGCSAESLLTGAARRRHAAQHAAKLAARHASSSFAAAPAVKPADRPQPAYVYCLAPIGDCGGCTRTYIGATVDLPHRLREHCGLIKGGARKNLRAAKQWKAQHCAKVAAIARRELRDADDADAAPPVAGEWHMIRFVSGFPTWRAALQFEWRWTKLSQNTSLDARYRALDALLRMPAATSTGVPYSDFERLGGHRPRVQGPLIRGGA